MINRDSARSDGFTEEEIDRIEEFVLRSQRNGTFSNKAELVNLPKSGVVWVCETVAQAIEQVRPGTWLRANVTTTLDASG